MQGVELRAKNLEQLQDGVFDVLVVGAGINGAVSAACMAARGARVALVDRGDFGGVTSQSSSNLAWGGIKYLESFEFGLVAKLCASRNHLLRSFPSAVREIRFFVGHEPGFRHGRLKLFLGALLYWFIGLCKTRAPRLLSRADIAREEPMVRVALTDGGFEYSDAYLQDNDARFVWNFVRRALDEGAACANYVELLHAEREDGVWVATLRCTLSGKAWVVRAKTLINTAGPYSDELGARIDVRTEHTHAFSKGIHLIVPQITRSKRVLTFFADDGRLFFAIPMGARTCIGTTDTRVSTPESEVTPEDRAFVLANINKRLALATPLTEADIISERCGVRPLATLRSGEAVKDWMQMSRKHVLEVNEQRASVAIFGGKLTDCVNVGEEVARAVGSLGVAYAKPFATWYGEPALARREAFFAEAARCKLDELTPNTSSEQLSARLWRRYGVRAGDVLAYIAADGREANLLFEGAEHVRAELRHARAHEMVSNLDDYLRRRTKLSMVLARDVLARAPGMRECAQALFGDHAASELAHAFGEHFTSVLPTSDRDAGAAL